MDSNKPNYVYNSTKIYRNNYPIDINIDSICDELYDIAGNRSNFEEIMKKLENDILTSDNIKKAKEDKKLKKNAFYSYNDLYNGNKFVFKSTLPEGEIMKEPTYQTSVLHKKYTDVNANSKFYFPQKDQTLIGEQTNFKTQWTNRANKIILDNQNLMGNSNMMGNTFNNVQNIYASNPLNQDVISKTNSPRQANNIL